MDRKSQTLINLLPKEEFITSNLGKVLHWAMNSFRVIVILTELVVMAAFLSRFWLDAKNTDLTDLIKQKQAVIAASADFEKEFKLTQERLKIFSTVAENQGLASSNLDLVTSYLPVNTLRGRVYSGNICYNCHADQSYHQQESQGNFSILLHCIFP